MVCAAGSKPVQQALIHFREGCAYRSHALAWQRATGHAIADAMEFGTLEGILGCVSVGLGWTLMPRRVVEKSLHAENLVIHSLPDAISQVPSGLICLGDAPPLAAPKTLGDAVTSAQHATSVLHA